MKSMMSLVVLAVVNWSLLAQQAPPHREAPRSLDPRLEVVLFAQEPDIVHPVAVAFDKKGRLLVVESHSHFRPANYTGPKFDRIRLLEDTDGDGRADRFTTFFEGTSTTMDIALHPDGSIYLATRNEILRLRDTKGTGVADEQTRIVFLETNGDYPHNGLSGLAFDHQGNLFFGLGENLGEGYRLSGSDGAVHAGGGEGGNIFWCAADGGKLRRYATGFWNPFGIHMDRFGRIVAVDNDPDSTPPCRMVHVVDGGDYGYQFRYGRSGRHPFQAWNGQLPGTLPMICGTGEAPCEVLRYESNGLPVEYFGQHFVTAWADHRLERYELKEQGASFIAQQKILVQGGKDFRPTGLAVALDGSLFMGDWVLPDYQLHGKGSIWQVRPKQPFTKPALVDCLTRDNRKNSNVRHAQLVRAMKDKRDYLHPKYPALVRVEALAGLDKADDLKLLMDYCEERDPFLQQAAILQLSKQPELLDTASLVALKRSQTYNLALLLAGRESGNSKYLPSVERFLNSPNEEVRFLAAKWVADQALKEFRSNIEAALRDPKLSVRMTMAYSTALARIDGQDVSEARLADRFVERLQDASLPDAQKLQLLRMVPASHPKMTLALLEKFLASGNKELQLDAVLTVLLQSKAERLEVLKRVAENEQYSPDVRAFAKLGLAEAVQRKIDVSQRPALDKPSAWLTAFGKDGNAEAGRRIFYDPHGPGCFRCHSINGRGNEIGPDLSSLGRSDHQRMLESLIMPSATVAPQYQSWTLVMHDGRTLTGMLVKTYLDEYTYLDAQGKLFTVKTHQVAETVTSAKSIMPEGLLQQMTDQEVRDLLAYLFSRK